MADSAASPALSRSFSFWSLGSWPTGPKIFLILSAALLPLAVIGFFASLQVTRNANDEARARLRVTASESSRRLGIELIGDMTALRAALNALELDNGDAPSCARAQGVFAQQSASGTRFVIMTRDRRTLCGAGFPTAADAQTDTTPIVARIIAKQGVVLTIVGNQGSATAAAYFPAAFLAQTGRPAAVLAPYEARLTLGDDELELASLPPAGALERREDVDTMLGVGDLALRTTMASAPITPPMLIAMLLPILMWAAAASIAWLVVDTLLIRPLRQLRRSVAAFEPGREIDPGEVRSLPASEIRELGETFRTISATVAAHETGLADGLVRQTRLTREVHHRVKNNLQVVSSLINFHARGAPTREATDAYAAIQRRVDALAVVHRHHFAELEENRGLSLRAVIGELASNIRATAPESAAGLAIVIEIDPYLATQDTATAVSFLLTEIVEMAMLAQPGAQIRISVKPGEGDDRATLRISAPALIDGPVLRDAIAKRYGRVIEGLARQLRSRLHHDPLIGAYEIAIAVTGRD